MRLNNFVFVNKGERTKDVETKAKTSNRDSQDAKSVVDGIKVCNSF